MLAAYPLTLFAKVSHLKYYARILFILSGIVFLMVLACAIFV